MSNVRQPLSKYVNNSKHATTRSTLNFSNVSRLVKRLYQSRPVKVVCSSNLSKRNASNVSRVNKIVKPLTVSEPVCLTIVSKDNICNPSIISLNIKVLNVSKSKSSCNVPNQNFPIVNSISHHIKPLNVGKSVYSNNVSKPVTCKSSNKSVCNIINECQAANLVCKPACAPVFVNHKRTHKRFVNNVSNHKHGVRKSLNLGNMTSIYFYELVLLFIIFYQNFWNSNVNKVMLCVTIFLVMIFNSL